MTVQHINRITGDQNAAAPLYQQDNGYGRDPMPLTGLLIGAPFSLINQATNPHRLLFIQAVFVGLYISNIKFEALTSSTALAMVTIILGLWLLFYVPVVNLVAKATMSAIYALIAYRLTLWLVPDITLTGDVFSLKHIATSVPIASNMTIYVACFMIFVVTMFMQRNIPLSKLEQEAA